MENARNKVCRVDEQETAGARKSAANSLCALDGKHTMCDLEGCIARFKSFFISGGCLNTQTHR